MIKIPLMALIQLVAESKKMKVKTDTNLGYKLFTFITSASKVILSGTIFSWVAGVIFPYYFDPSFYPGKYYIYLPNFIYDFIDSVCELSPKFCKFFESRLQKEFLIKTWKEWNPHKKF